MNGRGGGGGGGGGGSNNEANGSRDIQVNCFKQNEVI